MKNDRALEVNLHKDVIILNVSQSARPVWDSCVQISRKREERLNAVLQMWPQCKNNFFFPNPE